MSARRSRLAGDVAVSTGHLGRMQFVRTRDTAERAARRAAGALGKMRMTLKADIALTEAQLSTPIIAAAAGTFGKEAGHM